MGNPVLPLSDAYRPVMVWFHGGAFSSGSGHELKAYYGENLSRRGNRNHNGVGIGAAHCFDHGPRYVGNYRAIGADVVVDRARQCIAMAIRLPVHGEFAFSVRLPKIVSAHRVMVFKSRRFPCHHAAWKNDIAVVDAGGLRELN